MQPRRAEYIDYGEIQRVVGIATDAGDLNKIKVVLEPLLSKDDCTRSAAENLFLYKALGRLYREMGMGDESQMAFSQAYGYDSRDLEVLEEQAGAVLRGEPVDDSERVLQRILLHHRFSTKPQIVARVYQAMGARFQSAGELDQARVAYEKALEVRPGDMELISSLLSVAEESGDDEAIVEVREKLLATLTNAESRAAVLVAIGDDYIKRFNDPQRAIDAYERALAECAVSEPALLRVVDLSVRREDWHRAVGALVTLGETAEDVGAKIKYLAKAATIYKDHLNETIRAVQVYNQLLDLDPLQLDIFKILARILLDQEDWAGLEENYVRMIERHRRLPSLQSNVMVVLCRNLGELRLRHLNNLLGAAQAYQVASDILPDNVGYHQILGDLYGRLDDSLDKAVAEQREILRLAPDKLEAVDALAVLYRRMGRFDESLCVYRVLDVLQRLDEEGARIVEKFNTPRPPRIDMLLTDEIWEYLRSELLERSLLRLFSITGPALAECFAHDLDFYGLREKEAKIALDEPTVVARNVLAVAKPLGFHPPPNAFLNPKLRGMRNAYLLPPALLVGTDMVSGREEREVAFACAKAVALLRPEFYISQFGGSKVMEGVIYTVFKTVRPDLNIDLSKNMLRVSKVLERKLTHLEFGALKSLVDERIESGTNLNVRLFMEAAEDTVNRVGLLFADDPRVAQRILEIDESNLSTRSVPDRLGPLLVWAISEQYMALRKRIGVAISA